MPHNKQKRWLWLGALALIVAGAAVWATLHWTRPTAQTVTFADGTQAFFYSDSKIEPVAGFPTPREMKVDGEFFIRVPKGAPMIIRTRLMVLTVTGESAIRIIAHSHEAGEQVDVLQGHVQAKKAYKSHYEVPDELGPTQMVMINRTIDLMEKEKCEMEELNAWVAALLAAAKTGARKPYEK